MRRLAPLFVVGLVACGETLPTPRAAAPAQAAEAPAQAPPEGPEAPRPGFVVHVADVGTGLAVFVQGEDFALVYDGGSNDDTATGDENRFVAYLHAVTPALATIDHLVLSHPHRDHVELLPDLIKGYAVHDVWDSGAINPICGYRRFVQAIAQSPGLRYHSGAGEVGRHELDFGRELCPAPRLPPVVAVEHGSKVTENVPIALGKSAAMTFLCVDGTRHGERFNENSLVAVLDLDGSRVLLMGDAEAGERDRRSKAPTSRSVEGYVLGKYRKQLDADVLIVGHHGSKSSSREAFIAAVTPKVSVISSGPAEYRGVVLPDPEVVEQLERAGKLFRTDLDDAACAKREKKIGPDADGNPGGCDNVQIKLKAGALQTDYARLSD